MSLSIMSLTCQSAIDLPTPQLRFITIQSAWHSTALSCGLLGSVSSVGKTNWIQILSVLCCATVCIYRRHIVNIQDPCLAMLQQLTSKYAPKPVLCPSLDLIRNKFMSLSKLIVELLRLKTSCGNHLTKLVYRITLWFLGTSVQCLGPCSLIVLTRL